MLWNVTLTKSLCCTDGRQNHQCGRSPEKLSRRKPEEEAKVEKRRGAEAPLLNKSSGQMTGCAGRSSLPVNPANNVSQGISIEFSIQAFQDVSDLRSRQHVVH